MNYVFYPSQLRGFVSLPRSKSLTHRRIIAAMLSKKSMILSDVLKCDDTLATLDAFRAIGGKYHFVDRDLYVDGSNLFVRSSANLKVNASASTLRFMIPICLTHKGRYCFEMADSLVKRSIEPYIQTLKDEATFTYQGNLLYVEGKLKGGHYKLDGSHSSQFISGMLWALPLLEIDSCLEITNKSVSKDYIALTLDVLKDSDLDIKLTQPSLYHIKGQQTYDFKDSQIEYDASSLAFLAVANYLGQNITWPSFTSKHQADSQIFALLEVISQGNATIDVSDIPDLVPILSLAMALSPYEYSLINAKRLKDKETNRLQATYDILKAMGANIQIYDDGLIIKGVSQLKGASVSSYQDHRIAMMVAIAASVCEGQTVLTDGDCVAKSWPSFYEEYQRLGGKFHEQ